jgi:cellulose synthase/poly-beta-1,6-N-acetylglucosamine synthase-like glycosyltransferase
MGGLSDLAQGGTAPMVSVIVPVRNEERHIEACLRSIFQGSYPAGKLEVFVVDGCSEDLTVDKVQKLIDDGYPVTVLRNDAKMIPHALNIAIRKCTGDYVCRIDAHAAYPVEYIRTFVDHMERRTDVDNIGCAIETVPSSPTRSALAIALAMSHPFGVGDAHFRTGVEEETIVDTVPFGFFRRSAFERYGLFDEDMLRHEDGEMNHRIIRSGGKILLIPGLKVTYYARDRFIHLARMYHQYGYFKPLAQAKLKRPVSYRQFAPVVLLTTLATLFGSAAVWRSLPMLFAGLAFLGLYSAASVASALHLVATRGQSVRLVPAIAAAFWTMHFSWGSGYFRGLVNFVLLKRRMKDIRTSR